ncbi:hypothetical protein [Lentzea sp. NBRC 102530]|uniref:hypothetical protein n=1 Tax=Lentzea sp. NBRC 102530 TaxID=3032201 RepID=UPI0024A35938|nr:hypothetical protein [Lentzea sp. NBRC 102530]GLY54325.1 hypothetical protein Lesp01_79810 [Lentzea sp. NBRC 102530]
MDLPELCFHLRHRRRMYLPDDRYASAVAFVVGFDQAHDGVPLAGFQEYVAARVGMTGSPLVWSYLLAGELVPDVVVAGDRVPAELDVPLTDRLVEVLEAFVVISGGELISDVSEIRARRAERDRRSGRAPGS